MIKIVRACVLPTTLLFRFQLSIACSDNLVCPPQVCPPQGALVDQNTGAYFHPYDKFNCPQGPLNRHPDKLLL